jgi:tetratricopeptide (TPR) repeat protein
MTPADSQPSPADPVEVDKEIEPYQQKILNLIAASIQQTGGADIANGSDIAKEIAEVYVQMGEIFLARQHTNKAASCYETALQLNPNQWTARLNLLKIKGLTSGAEMAKGLLQGLVAERPGDAGLLSQLGNVQYHLDENEAAIKSFQQAHAADPKEARNLLGIANAQQGLGDAKAAEENYIRAIKMSPVLRTGATKAVPDFSVLTIFTPFVGNTPTAYLMDKVPYEANQFVFLADMEYDIELLKRSGQVVVNMTTEADMAHSVLPQIAKLVDQLDMPVINHPSKVQKTSREDISRLLRDIPGCRLAQVVRHNAGEPVSAEVLQAKISFPFPVLARPTGTHGGKKFEMIDSPAALAEFIRQEPAADHYIMEYIDYQSRDGHFRKYRFFFVDDKIMPYHLAIGDHWKVHHNTTDMANQKWMQDEEKVFLGNPQAVFTPKNYDSLRAIQQAVGLEYFGIDCGLDQAGNLVVFEVNATMLVHNLNEKFPYKTPYVQAIKQAFEDMLRKYAMRNRAL